MPTPSIQTLRNDAQQVLNLDSISAVRSVVAATLANANAGTPLNPNLTTQQLWNEFYQIVTQPKSDIESIIANQLMKFMYAPPAPGGVGANGQVIFNDGGVLAGDAGLTFDKVTNALTITGDLTVRTDKLAVRSTGVGIGTTTPNASYILDLTTAYDARARQWIADSSFIGSGNLANGFTIRTLSGTTDGIRFLNYAQSTEFMRIDATGLGVGTSNFAYKINAAGFIAAVDPSFTGTGGSLIGAMLNNDNTSPGLDIRRWTGTAGNHGTTYISTDATGATFFYNGVQASNTKATSLKMTLDASGRLLVGNTSAFTDLTGSKEVRVGDSGMQTLTVASLPAATATSIARGGVGGLVYVGGYNGTGQYGAVVLWTAASATVVSVINGTGSTITFGVSAGFLQITSSLVLTQVTASCIRI